MNNLRIKNLHKRLLKAGGKIVKEDSYLFKNKRADGGEVKTPPRKALYALANKLADQKVARNGGTRNDYFMEAIKHIKANPERYREELSKYVDETPISVNNDIEDPEIVSGMTRGDYLNADDNTRKNMVEYVNYGQYGENNLFRFYFYLFIRLNIFSIVGVIRFNRYHRNTFIANIIIFSVCYTSSNNTTVF